MKDFLALGIALTLTGCQSDFIGANSEVIVDQTFTSEMANQAVKEAFGSEGTPPIFLVCGPAAGKGLYDDNKFGEFQSDGISDGRLVFHAGSDGSAPDVVFRDAGGNFVSSVDDGADVRIVDPDRRMWVVAYPTTGVVETHNFVLRDAKLIDLWTSNKPAVSAWGPSAKIFTSNCIRP